ncbi:MAG: hypothetical protein ACK4I8_07740 [Armatimonadota bacterium]
MGWQGKMTKSEKLAVERYLRELRLRFPEIAKGAYFRPSRDTIVFVYANVPDEGALQKVRNAMLPVVTELSVKYRTMIVLIPKSDEEVLRDKLVGENKFAKRRKKVLKAKN